MNETLTAYLPIFCPLRCIGFSSLRLRVFASLRSNSSLVKWGLLRLASSSGESKRKGAKAQRRKEKQCKGVGGPERTKRLGPGFIRPALSPYTLFNASPR